jgi:rare lipoprotein A (peptidoglycan hydrolase)
MEVTDQMGKNDPPERSMDLSLNAARELDMVESGVAFLEVYEVHFDSKGHFDLELPR